MMYLFKHKPLAVILSGLLVFSACKKDSDSDTPAPVVEPITVTTAKPNDTLTLKGQNFSTTTTGNTVKIGDVEATVISATATEIKIVIPDIPTAGTYTITVTVNGKTTEVGTIVITPLVFYVVKEDWTNGPAVDYKVMTMNPKDGSESLVASVGQPTINSLVYVPASNEVMGVADNDKLVRVNVTTKQVTTVTIALPPVRDVLISELVVDKNGNLYGVKNDWSGPQQILTLVKIDPATGNNTDIKAFVSPETWYSPVYVPATNEIAGITNNGKRLFRLNLTTKDTVGVDLPGSTEIPCRELIVDNKSNLFAYKNNQFTINNGVVTELVKVNAVTGQETLLKVLPTGGEQDVNLLFVPQWNEFIGIWEQSSLYRINASSFNITPVALKAGPWNYIDIISN